MKCENYTYLQGQAEESLGECYLDTPQFALLKLSHTAKTFCEQGSGTESCRNSQSLETSKNLTDDRGEEQLTLFAEDSHVKTSPLRVKEQELPAHVLDSGKSMRDLLEKFGLDLFLPKTHHCFELGGLELSSKIWPRWGMMQDGECWELGTLVRRIKETECGYWPTPCTRDYKGARGMAAQRRKGNPLDTIPNAVAYGGTQTQQNWPTPTQSEWKGRGPNSKQQGLTNQVPCTGAQLNPSWVEWLMGWPIGWTELKPLETDKFRNVQQWHSEFYQKD